MANTTEHKKFILTDALENNNKFWEYTIFDDNTIEYRWGRVGSAGQSKKDNYNKSALNSKVNEKTKKGYAGIEIIAKSTATVQSNPTSVNKTVLKEAAHSHFCQDDSNPILASLINKLVDANKHEIIASTGGMMNVDVTSGVISTALGVVGKDNITQAKDLLDKMAVFVQQNDIDNTDYLKLLNNYLMKVPQKVGSSKGWHKTFIHDDNAIQKQSSLLDQLEASVDLAYSKMAASTTDPTVPKPQSIFDVKLKICEDNDVIKMVEKLFFSTLSQQHTSSRLKPKRVYEVEIAKMKQAFQNDGAKIHNIQMLWHGTRVFNVLSILKNGLIIPPTRGGTYQIAGRMFGNGIYTAKNSGKSLNYSYGYWDSGPKDNNCFMFLCDIAMGNHYVPKSSSESLPKPGYDSTWAKPGISGIINDEIIVYRTSQCNIRYLVEFGE